jgi:hypothetical protein
MKRSICGYRSCFAALVVLALVPGVARAQNSDRLFEGITDHTGAPVAPARTLSYTIPEGAEGPMIFAFPALTVDFYEPLTPPTISDRFHFDPYTVSVQSDDNPAGLPRRPGAILIPFAALETFTGMYIAGGSDGNMPPGPDSDRLTITVGSYAGFAGTTLLDLILPEGGKGGEFAPFGALSVLFDVEEPNEGQPGWQPGIVSDYVDILDLTGFFLSSDDPTNPHYQGPPNGIIIEKDAIEWGRLDYRLNFQSDVVPAPGTLLVLGMGMIPALLPARRRRAR